MSSFFKSSGTSVTIQNTIDTLITDAEAAKAAAETAANNASTSASLSSTSANNSSTSAANSASSLSSAQAAQSAAETAETNAETAETAAETAATNSANSASTASTQASNASTSATNAASSASTASTKASEASTSETNAATSATNSANSATASSGSASTASTQASNAASSASTASTQATNASTSATNAASSASTATTKASEASTSATNAATSASTASTQATNAANSATAAATSATNAATSATSAASSASTAQSLSDSFNNIYLGALSSAPSQDPDGSALDEGDLYYDTTQGELKVYKSSGWAAAGSTVNGTSARFHYDITGTIDTVTGADANGNTLAYDAGYVDVYVNGVRMSTADITTTSGNSIDFADDLVASDEVDIVAYGTFNLASMNASNLSSGTVPSARVSGAYTGITGTGALNSGSITSGFGNINTGSSTITTTGAASVGALTAGSLSIDDITIDGTEIDLSSGSFTIDSAANITLDCGTGEFLFNNGGNGNLLKIQGDSSNVNLISMVQDKDIRFKGNDGGSTVTALTLDMSDAGTAVFNNRIRGALASDGSPTYSFGNDTHTGMFSPANDIIGFSTGGTERMRIDSSGSLLIGQTSSTVGSNGHSFNVGGYAHHTNTSDIALYLNRKTSDGNILEFRKDNTGVGRIGSSSSRLYIASTGNSGIRFRNDLNCITPCNDDGSNSDNDQNLGQASVRYGTVFATSPSINTSDRNEKQDIEELSDAEKRVAVVAKGLMKKFKWKDAVALKGDNARTHFGIIAQDLQDAFTAESLDASDYAMFCSDTWWELDGEIYKTKEQSPEGATEKTRLGVRYSELLAFIISAI